MRHLRTIGIAAAFGMVFTLAPLGLPENTAQATGDSPQTCLDMHGSEKPELNAGDSSFEIWTPAQLVYLSENFDKAVGTVDGVDIVGEWREQIFYQQARINLDGCLFTPIGDSPSNEDGTSKLFEGTYDGQWLPIQNLLIDTTGDFSEGHGLFRGTKDAVIRQVVLRDVTVSSTGSEVGALVGSAISTQILDSSASGTITTTGGGSVGGLVGSLVEGSTINNSSADVTITTTGLQAGGLVGRLGDSSSITDSFARGAVNADRRAGGLVGTSARQTNVGNKGIIVRSYATGAVSANSEAGGLVGFLANPSYLEVKDSYAAGEVTGGSGTTGGLIGAQAQNGVTLAVSASFWDTTTSEQQNSLGDAVGLPTSEMRTLSTFSDAGWEIIEEWDDIQGAPDWGLRSTVNGGYPFLLWEYDGMEPWFCGVLDEEGFYQVSNADELASVGAGWRHGPCGLGDKYRQVQNIDLADWGSWEPIGANSFDLDFFSGHYNGGGFRIDDMSIESEWTLVDGDERTGGQAAGLFFALDGATISNLKIAGAQIAASDEEPTLDPNLDAGVEARKAVPVAGILAGYSLGSTIDNVEVSGTLEELDTVAGGLIGVVGSFGQESTTTISNCSIDVAMTTVDNAETTLGGIVGAIATGAHVEISACDDVKVNMTVNLAGTPQFQNIFELFRFEFPGPQPTGDNGGIGPQEAAIVDVIEEVVGIVGGVVGGIDLASSLTLRDISLSAESSIIVTVEEPTDPDSSGSPLALGGLLGFAAGAVEITDSAVGSASAQGSQFDADPALLVVRGHIPFVGIGGLAGMALIPMNFGQLEITSSSAVTQVDIEVDFFEMGVGGLLGFAFNPMIVSSSAVLDLDFDTSSDNRGGLLIGGLVGGAFDPTIDKSDATVDFSITTTKDSDVDGFFVGGLLGEIQSFGGGGASVSHSSAQGTISVAHEGIVGDSATGGLVGVHRGPGVINDVWSAVDITVDATEATGPPCLTETGDPCQGEDGEINAAGVAVGGGFGAFIFDPYDIGSEPSNLEVRNVLVRGSTELQTPTPATFAFRGSFAGLLGIDPDDQDEVMAENNFTLESGSTPLVGATPDLLEFPALSAEDFGITALSAAALTSITPYQNAGWGIVPANAGNLPAGPPNEVWGILDTGGCAPYLWWQIADVLDTCQEQPPAPPAPVEETGSGGGGSGTTGPSTTTNSGTGTTTPSTPDTTLLSPSGSSPLLTPQTEDSEEEDAQQAAPLSAEAAESSDVSNTPATEDNSSAGNTTGGVSTAWLWAIGLGGLGAAALIAGGVAWFRVRV